MCILLVAYDMLLLSPIMFDKHVHEAGIVCIVRLGCGALAATFVLTLLHHVYQLISLLSSFMVVFQ